MNCTLKHTHTHAHDSPSYFLSAHRRREERKRAKKGKKKTPYCMILLYVDLRHSQHFFSTLELNTPRQTFIFTAAPSPSPIPTPTIALFSLSPDTAAVDALDEVLRQGRGKVALHTAAVEVLQVALPVAQIARRREQAPKPLHLKIKIGKKKSHPPVGRPRSDRVR